MKNILIRKLVKDSKLHLWQLADRLGISDSTLSRKLRYELDNEELLKMKKAIEELRRER